MGKASVTSILKNLFIHPAMRGIALESPDALSARRTLIAQKLFLRRIYEEWYTAIATSISASSGKILEIGSGAGFLKDFIADAISSEISFSPDVDVILDACTLPCKDSALAGLVMVDVFHHLSKPVYFLKEAGRCVKKGGVLVMIEPWVTPWSRWVYTHLHHEPFKDDALGWEFPAAGPLSGANSALPWIVFKRDREKFEQKFPEWKIATIKPMMPFRYIVSGGVSYRSFAPYWSYRAWKALEETLTPYMQKIAMFAQILLIKTR
ncbi:MAG: class I SAM-dependent methyltransferase [Candidatus Omnitrophica bacterium]|nr:class I SAM-dependent methyltransferase [Candidatus Omnitrophota bacterium]